MALTAGQIVALDSTARGKCANQILQTLVDLALEGPGGRWYFLRVPHLTMLAKSGVSYPFGCVSPFTGVMSDSEGALNQAATHFRYIVALARGANFDYQGSADLMFLWDQTIRREFRKTHPSWLSGMSDVRQGAVTVVDGAAFVEEAFRQNVDALWYLVDVQAQEFLKA